MYSKKSNLKEEEKRFTTAYMEHKYQFTPNYEDSGLDIPDCYFKYLDNYYAVEVTRYFQQNSERNYQQYVRDVEKYFKSNFFEEAYNRLGKTKSSIITIGFYNIFELISFIIDNIKYVEYIMISNKYYYFHEKDEILGQVILPESSKIVMSINEFLLFALNLIFEEKPISLCLFTKNKYKPIINFKYCKLKDYDKRIIPVCSWYENEKELYDNIIEAIIKKNNKLINDYIPKLKNYKLNYQYYNLIVYSEGIPAELDEEKLFNEIIQIDNLQYQEIAIFLWKKIMVVTNGEYQIYSTN